jgi:ribonuclease HI
MASRVFCRGEPECLRDLLPEEDNRKKGITRSCMRGEIDSHQTALMIGRKAFRYWAREAYNSVCKKITTRPEPKDVRQEHCKNGKAPEDCEPKQRAAYYAHLDHKYKSQKEALDERGRVIIYTDGSAVRHETSGWKAGAGVFYGDGNKRNRALGVNGPATNQRAELAAVLHCLQNEERPMHIMTDSKYVQLGIEQWRHRWRANGWYKSALQTKEIDHADMWARVDNLLLQKEADEFQISWVKGHAMPRHIAAGLTEERHIWGNNAADRLAGGASSL